jgi:RHS repeat-associated protein
MGLVNATNGNISAKYEYGPFGEVFCSVGDMAKVNPFQFSTKYTDNETDLLYYGYRYYSPALGRWLSRDPIEEQGGLNLYGFVNNDPVNKWDMLGLQAEFIRSLHSENWKQHSVEYIPYDDRQVGCIRRCGTVVSRAIRPTIEHWWDYISYVGQPFNMFLFPHEFIILPNGERYTFGGEADGEDHWTALEMPIFVCKTSCEIFQKCIKVKFKEIEKRDETGERVYCKWRNNCRDAVKEAVSECRGFFIDPTRHPVFFNK